jgi:hypothetical protein
MEINAYVPTISFTELFILVNESVHKLIGVNIMYFMKTLYDMCH